MKSPAVLFYTSDFLTGVSNLTMEERGQYITILCLQHQLGHLSKKAIDINVPSCSVDVINKLTIDDQGLYYHHRMEEEIQKREHFVETRYENGYKGGRPKNNHMDNHKVSHMGNHIGNDNDNVNDNINNSNILLEVLFNTFWKSYPKKLGKGNVEKWFTKNNPSKELVDKMVLQVERYKDTKSWKEKDGQFIPYPTTWLNGKMWEDEFETETEEEERIMSE